MNGPDRNSSTSLRVMFDYFLNVAFISTIVMTIGVAVNKNSLPHKMNHFPERNVFGAFLSSKLSVLFFRAIKSRIGDIPGLMATGQSCGQNQRYGNEG